MKLGHYRLEERLGAGGMGIVYRAHDERLDRRVALKLIAPDKNADPQARERLRREARASARLSHPAIVQTYDLIETEEADAIVMELVEGTSLASLLRQGPFEPAVALGLAREIAEALAEAHDKGIIHRDLKTENVFLTPGGHAKVLDFGIAKHLDPAGTQLTGDGVVLGTCRAMSPEQAQGHPMDHRSDLFSLGTLLYELATGQSPFLGESTVATLWRVCSDRQKPARAVNPRVPESLSALIDNLLEKQPHLRPESAQIVAATLAMMAAGSPAESPEDSSEPGLPTWVEGVPATPSQVSAERRQVTVLHCEMVRAGGTPFDPEDLLAEAPRLHSLAAEVLQRLGGSLRPAAGPGIVGFFGYPRAYEDSVRRAVRAGLEIADQVRRLGPAGGEPLQARIGIHTGIMVIPKTTGSDAVLTLGDIPNVAALLQRIAPANTVLVSEAIHRLSEGFFRCEALEPVYLPGGTEPLWTYRVLSDSGAHTRIEVASVLSPLVAREQELGLLLSRWALAREGKGQVALVAGEAGLGKSRLVWELRQRVVADAAAWLESWASPFHAGSAFYSVLQWLRQWIGAERQEAPETQLARLEEALARHGLPAADTVPLLASLLSIPLDERYAQPALSPDARRRQTLDVLLTVLLTAAERQPLLLVMEDLHWSDPSSLELLGLLIDHVPGSSLFLLITFRPEAQPLWADRSYLTRLTLSPLTRAQACQMIEQMTREGRFDPTVQDQVALRTDGVPLFVEELTRMILESGMAAGRRERTGPQASLEIPATLEGWLHARLDRLGAAREVAQVAAVLGRELSFELLRAISPWNDTVLKLELNRLIEAEILYRRGFGLKYHYVFKHALLQDAAYASLLRTERQKYHRRAAEALERGFAGKAGDPELVAHHYTEAGLPDKALPFWRQAGQEAFQAFAVREAAGYLARAVEVLRKLPESVERDEQEMPLQHTLAEAWARNMSHAAPEVQAALSRALELCARVGSQPQLLYLQIVLVASYLVAGQTRQAVELGWKARDLALLVGAPAPLSHACHRLGFTLTTHGEFATAREILEEGLAIPLTPADFDPRVGHLEIHCEVILGWCLWFLGHPERAAQRCREALRRADEAAHPYTSGFVQFFAAIIFSLLDEQQAVGELADREALLGKQSSLMLWEAGGGFFQAWAKLRRDGSAEHLQGMQDNAAKYMGHGALCVAPYLLALLADGYRCAGRLAEALAALDEAAAVARQGEQVFFDSELSRLRGEVLADQGGDAEEIAGLFQEALAIARQQQARSLELRAAMSLARHWRRQGRRAEARGLLEEVHGAFTEGLGTADLKGAQALLAELG
jgi:class 3 adenylate cyclase/tetratricopeptide (TPR) repeat protein